MTQPMNLGIDLDGTALRYPEFFSRLTHQWRGVGQVYVLTARSDLDGARDECRRHNITADFILSCFRDDEEKARLIEKHQVDVMFDDMPEFSCHFPRSCVTLHVRNEDNFNYDTRQYLFTKYTGKIVRQYDDDSKFLHRMMTETLPGIEKYVGDSRDDWQFDLRRLSRLLEQINGE
jgi:hypothetical protein